MESEQGPCFILALPKDVLVLLLSYVYGKSIMALFSTCKRLHNIVDDVSRLRYMIGSRTLATLIGINFALDIRRDKCPVCGLVLKEVRYKYHIETCFSRYGYQKLLDRTVAHTMELGRRFKLICQLIEPKPCSVCEHVDTLVDYAPFKTKSLEHPFIKTECCGAGINKKTDGCFHCKIFMCRKIQCPLCLEECCYAGHQCDFKDNFVALWHAYLKKTYTNAFGYVNDFEVTEHDTYVAYNHSRYRGFFMVIKENCALKRVPEKDNGVPVWILGPYLSSKRKKVYFDY